MSRIRHFVLLVVWFLSISLLPQTSSLWQDSYILDFDYDLSSSVGPNDWNNITANPNGWGEWTQYESGLNFNLAIQGNECAEQMQQSPVNLFQTAVCPDAREIISRRIRSTDCNQSDVAFDITPYGLRAYFPPDDSTCIRPSILLNDTSDPFVLVWMELHARSEHVMVGKRYDAELQLVHLGTGNSNSVMNTVSILIEASASIDNADFQWFLDGWQLVANAQTCTGRRNLRGVFQDDDMVSSASTYDFKQAHDEDQRELILVNSCKPDRFGHGCEPLVPRRKMFPYSLWPSIWYYGYLGSITSPPCSSIVKWKVLDEPLRISRRQYKQLTSLLPLSKNSACQNDTAVSAQGENFRPLQQANQFPTGVYHCTFANFSYLVY